MDKENEFKKIIREAITNEVKVIVTGKSGWGKSEMVSQVAEELKIELIDFRLSEILPEDLVGIPKLRDDYYEYVPPKWLYNIVQNKDKKYLLFLDEITQATPEVLNICYKIFDKVTKIGDYTLDNVYVIGATNFENESDYLNVLPKPLQNRACMYTLQHDIGHAVTYLLDKYKINSTYKSDIAYAVSKTNPRSVDIGIKLILNDVDKSLCIPILTHAAYNTLKVINTHNIKQGDKLLGIEAAKQSLSLGYLVYEGFKYDFHSHKTLQTIYELSDEELEIIEAHPIKKDQEGLISKSDVLSSYFIQNIKKLYHDNSRYGEFVSQRDFNFPRVIREIKFTIETNKQLMYFAKEAYSLDLYSYFDKVIKLRAIPLDIMQSYAEYMPWDYIKAHPKILTKAKQKAFANRL